MDLTAAVDAGINAAWPGLPAGMPWDQAKRRATAAVEAAAPIIAAQVAEQIAAAIEDLQASEGLRLGRNRESDGARVYTPTEEARIVALHDAKVLAREAIR